MKKVIVQLLEVFRHCEPTNYVIARARLACRQASPLTPRNNKLFICFLILLFASGLFFPRASYGTMGIAVDPNEFNLVDVPLGKQVAVSVYTTEKVKLKINNKSSLAYFYNIDILPCGQTSAPLREGYLDIPDISWIKPENKKVKVEANSAKEVELYVKIPKRKEYYNKKYQAVIEVKSVKNQPKELFVLACQLKINFSTVTDDKKRIKPSSIINYQVTKVE